MWTQRRGTGQRRGWREEERENPKGPEGQEGGGAPAGNRGYLQRRPRFAVRLRLEGRATRIAAPPGALGHPDGRGPGRRVPFAAMLRRVGWDAKARWTPEDRPLCPRRVREMRGGWGPGRLRLGSDPGVGGAPAGWRPSTIGRAAPSSGRAEQCPRLAERGAPYRLRPAAALTDSGGQVELRNNRTWAAPVPGGALAAGRVAAAVRLPGRRVGAKDC